MNFRTTMGLGVSAALLLIVYSALSAIVAGIVIAAQILFWWLLGAGTLALLYVAWLKYQSNRNQYLRSVDGQFPLHPVKLRDGRTVIVDPNKMISAAGIIDAQGWAEIAPAAGWDHQTSVAKAVQATRSLAAIAPGDNAMIKTHGAISQPRIPANVTKILTGKEERPVVVQPAPVAPPTLPAIPRTPTTAQQMIAAPTPQTTRLAIGEEIKHGEIVYWDMEMHPFARVHGATQSGKTSLSRLLVAQAIRHGFEVIIIDRRRGKDWGIFGQHAQLIDAREPGVLVAALEEEIARYSDRDAQLGRYGAPNLAALGQITGNAYRRRLVVVEELGTQHMNARAEGRATYGAFVAGLRKLTAEAGATGIHGLYIDQIPDAWDKAVRYNASGSIVFHLPDYGGQVAGYPLAHQLPQFHCHYEGQIVRAGHLTDDQIRQTIGKVQPQPPAPVRGGVRGMEGGRSLLNTPTNTPTNTNTANTTAAPSTPSEWAIFAEKFFAGNPTASQRALTRAMAAAVNDGRPAEAFLGGLSSELFHRWSPRGANYQPNKREA